MKSYNPNYFDKHFFAGAKGSKRNADSPHYLSMAQAVFGQYRDRARTFLMTGDGRGYTAQHLLNMGATIDAFDISEWAVAHRVFKRLYRYNVVDLVKERRNWNIVVCDRVLAYLQIGMVPQALAGLRKVANERLVLAIICADHASLKIRRGGMPGRLTWKPKHWWLAQCRRAGLRVHAYFKSIRAWSGAQDQQRARGIRHSVAQHRKPVS